MYRLRLRPADPCARSRTRGLGCAAGSPTPSADRPAMESSRSSPGFAARTSLAFASLSDTARITGAPD